MKYNWDEIPLGEIAYIKTGKLNSNAAVVGGQYPFFTCSPEVYRIDTYAFDEEAILLAGNNAEGNFNIKYFCGKFNAYQRTYVITSKNVAHCNLKYLYFALKLCLQKFKALSQGTSTKFLTLKILNSFCIALPPMQEQKRIVDVLSVLDNKIELNQRINDNLERQLHAIFLAQFSENQTLESMEMVSLSDLCHVITKGTTPTTLGKSFTNAGVNFIKAESILDNHSIDINKFSYIDEETNTILKRSIIQSGDIIFTIAGTLGRFALVDESVLPANTNQAVAIIRANQEKTAPEYLYSFFIGNWHNDFYAKRVQQAVQANLSLTTIKSLPIPLLEKKDMKKYLQLITPIIRAIKENDVQSGMLSTLRNTLLPKLMSGEIDVSNIQV